MINWHKYPFIRLIVPYGFGIWLAINVKGLPFNTILVLFGLGMLVLLLAYFFLMQFRMRWVFGAALYFTLLLGGMTQIMLSNREMAKNTEIPTLEAQEYFVARIIEAPVVREQSVKLLLELKSLHHAGHPGDRINGRLLAYLQLGDTIPDVSYGDFIAFSQTPAPVESPTNPGQFDYHSYLARQGVFYQVYLRENEWKNLGVNQSNFLFRLAYLLRDKLLVVLQENGLQGETYAVASAILLGYDEVLPPYLRKGYVAAGAMHVLCVSGLHVGVIFLIAGFLLNIFGKGKRAQYLKTSLLLLIIWFYALLTGLSPSVQRASLMISFFLLGKLISRHGYALNSIAASAFFILLFNPQSIMNLGFQLSYAAVIGIVLLHRPIASSLYIKNKLLKWVWEITALAIAAQLATSPFVIFYFHQFPVYFWLSNLFLVPMSFVIIVSGMSLLILSFLPVLPGYLGMAVSGLIYFMNLGVHWIENLPYSVITGLYFSWFEFLLTLLLLVMLWVFVQQRQKWMIYLSLLASIALFASFTSRKMDNNQQSVVIVYDINRHTAVDFIYGTNHILLADSTLAKDSRTIGYQIEGSWIERGLSLKPSFVDPNSDFQNSFFKLQNGLISFQGKLFAIWDAEKQCENPLTYKPTVDLVLVTGSRRENLEQLLNCFIVKQIVLDGSMSAYHAKRWEEACLAKNIGFYNVSTQGAFLLPV